MFNWLKRTPKIKIKNDPDFGLISFAESKIGDFHIWQMESNWESPRRNEKISCCGIPGDASGPFVESRKFLLEKKRDIPNLWKSADLTLIAQLKAWIPDNNIVNPSETLAISSLSLDSIGETPIKWEMSFETTSGKWLFISLQMVGDRVESVTVDT